MTQITDTLAAADTIHALAPDTLAADTIAQALPEPVYYLAAQDSLLNHLITTVTETGKAGVPLPYLLRTDSSITLITLMSFFVLAYILAGGRRFLTQQLHDFFLIRDRSSLFAEETGTEARFRLLLVLQTCLMTALLVFDIFSPRFGSTLHSTPLKWVGIYMGMALGYYLLKYGMYAFTNWIFFDKKRRYVWLENYFFIFALEGLLLFPLTLLSVYFELSNSRSILFALLIFVFCKILLLYKCSNIFFDKIHRAFYLIVYFCALEIIPCLLIWQALIRISSL